MCSPKTPPAPTVVAPPPPVELPKPLGVDDNLSPSGVGQLRSGGRNGLAIRGSNGTRSGGGSPSGVSALAISGSSRGTTGVSSIGGSGNRTGLARFLP